MKKSLIGRLADGRLVLGYRSSDSAIYGYNNHSVVPAAEYRELYPGQVDRLARVELQEGEYAVWGEGGPYAAKLSAKLLALASAS